MESRHRVYAAAIGTPSLPGLDHERLPRVSMRSTAKPFQLVPLLAKNGKLDFEPADLALMVSSHHGTPEHAARVGALLQRLGLGPEHLRCGTHPPYFLDTLPSEDPARTRVYGPLHHNCSGSHAGFLALALLLSDDPARYLDAAGPGQQHAHRIVEALAGDKPDIVEDNCGSPSYDLPLAAIAQTYRFLADPDSLRALDATRRDLLAQVAPLDDLVASLRRIAEAMTRQPEWVSSRESAATRLARLCPPLILKHGAEGMLCAAIPTRRAALALKVADGNARAALPVFVELLRRFGWLEGATLEAARDLLEPPLRGDRGRIVGRLRVVPA
ncbi:MAG: asparaginase [Candidatus Latescibacterota bacterium]|nr:MAG: asparaginase [Candidatus Latescibacterota bacterium]